MCVVAGAYSAPEYALALSANFTLLPATLKKAGYTTHSALPDQMTSVF